LVEAGGGVALRRCVPDKRGVAGLVHVALIAPRLVELVEAGGGVALACCVPDRGGVAGSSARRLGGGTVVRGRRGATPSRRAIVGPTVAASRQVVACRTEAASLAPAHLALVAALFFQAGAIGTASRQEVVWRTVASFALVHDVLTAKLLFEVGQIATSSRWVGACRTD